MFGESFLPKEAKFGRVFKNTSPFGNVGKMKYMNDPVTDKVRFFSADEIAENARNKIKSDGNGLTGDLLIGSTRFLPKGKQIYNKLIDKSVDLKRGFQNADQATSQKVKDKLNVREGSMLDRFTRVNNNRGLGVNVWKDGTHEGIQGVTHRSSWTAPAQNTAKVATPFLASAFVADKLFPEEEEEQLAFESNELINKSGLNELELSVMLDKKAAFEKVASLEKKIEKLASHVEELEEEKNSFWKQAEYERKEKQLIAQEKIAFEKEMMDKISAHDEFRLRTNVRERSKNAVKVAEELLEHGIIKQAEFNKKLDFLMDCDDDTFNLHSTLTKNAESNQKGLETSAYFIDYSSKEEVSTSYRPERGLSIRGETIGEAAKDLKK